MLLNYIDFDRGEQNICYNCVDNIWGGGGVSHIIEGGGRQWCVRDNLTGGGKVRSLGGKIKSKGYSAWVWG